MLFPSLKAAKEKTGSFPAFTSLVTKGIVPDGGFSRMKNLCPDLYPSLSVRPSRGIYKSPSALYFGGEKITEMKHVPCGNLICTETSLYLEGKRLDATLDSGVKHRTAVPFGRNVFIVPDAIYIEADSDGVRVSDCRLTEYGENCSIGYCTDDGTEIFPSYLGEFPPAASASELVVIGDGTKMECWQYTGQVWKKMYDVYIKIFFHREISGIAKGDALCITGSGGLFDDGWHTVIDAGPVYLVVSGNLKSSGTCSRLDFTKSAPLMDFAVQHNNRIYGCRYGKNNEGEFVNEIYVSKLGDPCQWYSFQGISTDSYSVSLGCSGAFTGAAVLGSEVLFFKEDYVIRMLGSTPSDFTVYTLPLAGVEQGSHRSVCAVSDSLFYKSREGICVYDGNSVTNISQTLELSGWHGGVAGECDGRYRIALTSPEGERSLFVYDVKRRLWHCEDDDAPTCFIFRRQGNLFHVTDLSEGRYTLYVPCFDGIRQENLALRLFGDTPFTPEKESAVPFLWETGRLFENVTSFTKKIRCIRFALQVGDDSRLRLFIRADGSLQPVPVSYIDRRTDGIFTASVPVPACSFFTLCGEGQGEITLGVPECVINSLGEVREIE